VKEILISMNEKDHFIIEDLDDYHLVIKADEEYRVRRELEVEVCSSVARRTVSDSPSSWRRIRIAWRLEDVLFTGHWVWFLVVCPYRFLRAMEIATGYSEDPSLPILLLAFAAVPR
jgi:TFIIH basal transcription factor complex TTD-A subunit